jgi:glucosamine-6-phosphate deaminase
MTIDISPDAGELGVRAAALVADKLRNAIKQKGEARLVLSTGASQFETLNSLITQDIAWSDVEIFHLDEYIGLPPGHKASFRRYLKERFIDHVGVKRFYSLDVEGDIRKLIALLAQNILNRPVDIGLIGIGVNGHIAFNDPPADFRTRESYKVVVLDEQCRKQQVDEGWFSTMDEVPPTALSMTPWQIMQCKSIVSAVPHKVKAGSIKNTLINVVTDKIPATILKQHPDFHLFLDVDSASAIIPL